MHAGCFWTIEHDGEDQCIEITLEKATPGHESWPFLLESEVAKPDTTITNRVFMEVHADGKPLGKVALGLFGNVAPLTVENFRALITGEKVCLRVVFDNVVS